MTTPHCTDCLDLQVKEELVEYQSDRDVPSDLSDQESDHEEDQDKKSDDEVHSDDQQSDEEAQAIYRDMFGSGSESEEEGVKETDPNKPKVRRPRWAHQRRSRGNFVRMPTGKKYKITSPKPRKWNCKSPTQKITLHRYGRSKSEYQIVQKEMDKTIVHHPGQSFKRYKITKLQKLINGCLWKRYLHRQMEIKSETHFVNQRMLFHGSMKIDEIIGNGFNEQYASTNGMFGAGLYFAKHSSKANQYVFGPAVATPCPTHKDSNCFICERRILLCRVTLGKTKNEYTVQKYPHPPVGYNSVTGVPSKVKGGLKYPEYIVYRREQVYPEYLITYKISN